jgi:predicted NBD/HSP70 family sugar kinase/mannose-6-phosphate isomerase class I
MFKHTDKVVLGVDIGGSHISSALVTYCDGHVLEETVCKKKIDTKVAASKIIIDQWMENICDTILNLNGRDLKGIGIAMPGPFDYHNGISLLDGVNKYECLYGINIKAAIESRLDIHPGFPVLFENDAACFGLGEGITGEGSSFENVIAITLGTGFGASFIHQKKIMKEGAGVPDQGYLYNIPFKEGIAEDYISSSWLLKKYAELSGKKINEVKEIAEAAQVGDDAAKEVFGMYGNNLAACLAHWLRSFKADCLVIGGSISNASHWFLPELEKALNNNEGINIPIKISKKMELSAIAGAAGLVTGMDESKEKKTKSVTKWRKSSQQLMPQNADGNSNKAGEYNIYPFHSLGNGKIFSGYHSLAEWIITQKMVAIDGYIGNDWSAIREKLSVVFGKKNLNVLWYETSAFRKQEQETEQMAEPYLGEQDSVWGKKTTLCLEDFYNREKLENLQFDEAFDVVIVLGIGAGFCKRKMPVIYVDLPKNEIQYRMRSGSICNLGTSKPASSSTMYKRFYFVDWVVLNKHRQKIKDSISVVADGQWRDTINWSLYSSISNGLQYLGKDAIRVRPWFEAGTWGGQWMKEHIPSLNKNEINYAWSFELIVPENGLVFESDGNLLEVAFDWLMEQNAPDILGKDEERFGTEFPIRFDFLDTFDGGNLSIQCHPSLQYIQKNFGETITQDETYYILDCKKDAGVYLGFREDIDADEFREVLEKSEETDCPVEIEKYVQWHPAHKHDLFLIPNGTIHSSGANNLVLEISATPYIFTFKMYDWVRLDLDGNPRPINIDHAFNNLDFDRKGEKVKLELISHTSIAEKNNQYTLVHLPTHKEHFYDVHRIEFSNEAEIKTEAKCHVLMLVEGTSIIVKTKKGTEQRFNYAETFIIPAAAESYRLKNESGEMAKVIKAFIK